jgi:hypothetical protein
MWVIHDEDTRIVLLGGVHQLPDNLEWTGGRLATELELANELILEMSPQQSAQARLLFARMASDEPVASIDARFGAQADAVRRLAARSGINRAQADNTESWALALAIGNSLTDGHGLSAENGVETVLTAAFAGHDKPVSGLETAAVQLAMFDDLPPAEQDRMVQTTLSGASASVERTRRLLRAWANGDLGVLSAVADEAMAPTPYLVEPVIHARNRAWASQLVRRMERRGDVMVAVGVGHLVGEGSLLDELRARDLRPMRLQ